MSDDVEIEEHVELVTYVRIGESDVTKENLVKHLRHYAKHGKFEALSTGSLSDDIGKMLSHYDIVQPWKKQQTDPGEMPSLMGGGTRVGWKDNEGRATELFEQLTVEETTYKVRVAGRVKETVDTEAEAEREKQRYEDRNPDVRVEIDTETERVMEVSQE